jgi:hypothetical protein
LPIFPMESVSPVASERELVFPEVVLDHAGD